MLKNLIEIGKDTQLKFNQYTDWKELVFNENDKEELKRIEIVSTVYNHSIKFETDSKHIIVPSQYILYALAIKEFALGLKEHISIFEAYKQGKGRNIIGQEINDRTFDREALGLDLYSQTILFEPILNEEYNFNAKSLINGSPGNWKIRGSADFFGSIILKIINVPDNSSAILGKLTYLLASDQNLYNYLESRFMDYLPFLVKDNNIKTFARKILSYLYQYDGLSKIKELIIKNSDPSFSSIRSENGNLTSIFKTSTNLLSEEDLSQGGRIRYFREPLFMIEGEFYYVSTEWTDGTGSRLDLQNFCSILETCYPEFQVVKEGGEYLLNSSNTQATSGISDEIRTSRLFDINQFLTNAERSNLKYSNSLVTRYISSLSTKPFVLLSGLSGSGKTKLTQSFSKWICQDSTQYCIVPVGADWINREPLLGYVNALEDTKYILPENGALELIIRANQDPLKPYFLILDEMNLSHVERYFADFLSVMESNDKFKLHNSETPLAGQGGISVDKEYGWPSNLFVVGTVNIDETTYMFSPKVLDRANVIEFRVSEGEITAFLEEPKELTSIDGLGASMGESFVEIAKRKTSLNSSEELNSVLVDFFKDLQPLGAEFGFRTALEIQTLYSKIDLVNPDYLSKTEDKIDIAIMQKLLPKLHGSRRKLLKTLDLLAQKCLVHPQDNLFNEIGESSVDNGNRVKYKLSFEKISRMYKSAIENGFASYAEA